MNREKLEYLRTKTNLNPLSKARIMFLKGRGVSQEELDMVEYEERFKVYQKSWDKTWQDLNWGEKEDESLMAFADSALEQAISEEKGKNR